MKQNQTEQKNQKMTYEQFLKIIGEGTKSCPPALGLSLAIRGKQPMSLRLASYLHDCYEKNMSPADTVEGWI